MASPLPSPSALLREQARACAVLGSPLYAELLDRAADDAEICALLDGADLSVPALRLLGTVHRIVLEGRAPGLAAHYPTAGGAAGPAGAWPAFRATALAHADEVRAGLAVAPQTNEVGRAAALTAGLLETARLTGLPVRLLEIGASAGLNLRADRFRYTFPGGSHGPADSPVVLAGAWRGPALPPVDAPLEIAERSGCDLAPVDPADRVTLLSYVWPDQAERVARLDAARAVALEVPAEVVRAGAAEFLRGLEPRAGAVTVVWHSVMWQYLPAAERAGVAEAVAGAAALAARDASVAHLAFEPADETDAQVPPVLSLRLWPHAPARRVLADAPPHGLPTAWR
ncbi:DUF2332 domain-containing protein [Actinomadura parmotrematis]|uniref:DUF2332 domain-containing protein n=1 Tax=Actinomadura parmotrematis TaxID=2864039 RepID=A0ABS7FKV5_9ACTN|nr:DUF2332 domain-containing protein [Actinomadura parmotrematis]MBW8480986.1 DUF2332 domain-containing protein [Actinomadura parmotrematis]